MTTALELPDKPADGSHLYFAPFHDRRTAVDMESLAAGSDPRLALPLRVAEGSPTRGLMMSGIAPRAWLQ